MCTILCYAGGAVGPEELRGYLLRAQHRGPDDARLARTPFGYLGFARLAIMGLTPEGMQPFEDGGSWAVCNGEIYGFRPLRRELEAKGYRFRSDSDCEVLLPLWREHGCDMFRRLDAEFACVLYDGQSGSLVAARDPIGIRPLFYGRAKAGGIAFASEAIELEGWVEEIRPFPPGHYYKDGQFVPYTDVTRVDRVIDDPPEEISRNIREKLTAAVIKRLDADAPVGFLLSGGLDSSLVCAIAAKHLGKPIRTFAIGQVVAVLPDVVRTLATYDITTIRASVGMYLVCKAIHEQTDIKTLLTGEISDELFGYKYTDYAPSAAAFQQEAEKRLRELYAYDVLRADRCLAAHSLEARVPFGDLDFVRYVMAINPSRKLNTTGKGKYLLRQAFAGTGLLPDSILWREKAAFSDAVGHSMVDDLKAYAEQRYTGAEFAQKCAQYSDPRPFTQFYPGQAQMIPGYWMPNPAWPGCRVSDPSARVLANYGASGQ